MSERFDVVIVGAGPAGIAVGVQAARRDLSHVLLERAELANTIHRYQKGKWVMAEPVKLPLQPDLALEFEAASREEVLGRWEEGVRAANVNLRKGPQCDVTGIEGQKGSFEVKLKDGAAIEAGAVVLSIGTQGDLRKFGVPGDDLPHVTYQLDDPAEYEGKRIVVVGVGDAGIENALALVENDNEVWIVNRRAEFDRAKAANRKLIESAIKAGDIVHIVNANVDHFEEGLIFLKTNDGALRLEADLVIGRLGSFPPRKFLESVGIEFPSTEREAVPKVSDTFESNVPGIYLLGALVGRPLIKACMNGGYEVIEHILGNPVKPADEPLLEEILAPIDGGVSDVIERIRQTIPLFSSLTPIQLREFLLESKIWTPEKGEIVYERGEFVNELYSILEGSVEVSLPSTKQDADTDLRSEERKEFTRSLAQGEFFGEGGLLTGRRRQGTVRASPDALLIKTEQRAMSKLLKSEPQVARVVDTTRIERLLRDLAPAISPAELKTVASSAEIKKFKVGDVLFEEGDEPDGLHFIRHGSVAISRKRDGPDRVLNYVQAGNYLGQIALVRPEGKRSATARATVKTKTVLLPTAAIRSLLQAHPELKGEWEAEAKETIVADEQKLGKVGGSPLVDFLTKQGAGEATDLLVIDESLCIRCNNCEKACADTHQGVSRLDREGGPRYVDIHLPTACQHCENPKCMTDCPPDSIHRHPNGEVYIDDKCIGCGACEANCPYNVIQMKSLDDAPRPSLLLQMLFGRSGKPVAEGTPTEGPKHEIAVKCDLCRNLPQSSDGGSRAACVASCPTGAIVRVNPKDYTKEILSGQG